MKRNGKVKAGCTTTWRGENWVVKTVFKCIAVLVKPGDPNRTEATHVAELTNIGPWR